MRLPGWFRALVVLTMLAVCVSTCWYCVSNEQLSAQRQDLITQLETSRGRVRRQQREYNQVASALPVAQGELAEAQPLADEAKEREKELRAQRKALRSARSSLQDAIETLTGINEELQAIVDATQETRSRIPPEYLAQ